MALEPEILAALKDIALQMKKQATSRGRSISSESKSYKNSDGDSGTAESRRTARLKDEKRRFVENLNTNLNEIDPKDAERIEEHNEKIRDSIELDKELKKVSKELAIGITGLGGAFSRMAEDIDNPLSALQTLQGYMTIAMKSVDTMRTDIGKLTTSYGKYDEAVASSAKSLAKHNIDASQTGQLYGVLISQTAGFRHETEMSRKALIEQNSILVKAGVSIDDIALGYQIVTKTLGMTGEAWTQTNAKIFDAAEALEIPVSALHKELIEGREEYLRYGKNGVNSFLQLKTAAREYGVEIQALNQLIEKQDSFSDVSQFAGNINALLGQQVFDPWQMMMMQGPDLQAYIRENLMAQGISAERLSDGSRESALMLKTFSTQLGMTGEATLNYLSGVDRNAEMAKKYGMTTAEFMARQEEYSRTTTELSDMMKMLEQNVMMTFAPAIMSLINGLMWFTNTIKDTVLPALFMFVPPILSIARFLLVLAEYTIPIFSKAFGALASVVGLAISSIYEFTTGDNLSAIVYAILAVVAGIGMALASVPAVVIAGILGIIWGIVDWLAGGNMTEAASNWWYGEPETKLATGGVVTKPTRAMVGEGGEPEVVAPLSKLPSVLSAYGKTSGQTASKVEVKIMLDGKELKKFVKEVIIEEIGV